MEMRGLGSRDNRWVFSLRSGLVRGERGCFSCIVLSINFVLFLIGWLFRIFAFFCKRELKLILLGVEVVGE